MSFDKSITIGQAFDNWENCKNKEWEKLLSLQLFNAMYTDK
jgi:hypothetical protein